MSDNGVKAEDEHLQDREEGGDDEVRPPMNTSEESHGWHRGNPKEDADERSVRKKYQQ